MPKKPSKKSREYFTGTVDEAVKNKTAFAEGDKVKILPSNPKFPTFTGVIRKLVHGNFGKGRIHAIVAIDGGRTQVAPLGRLRKIK